ncbi:MAG: hypothetical protein AAB351_03625, partial [Patescibacteria group bacterium]
LKEVPANEGKFNPKGQYGSDPNNRPGTLFVEAMHTEIFDRHVKVYKGLGRALHQIAVERSLQLGYQGRVQLNVTSLKQNSWDVVEDPGFSAPFHKKFGFLAQDVYNEDGSLHHEGQTVHKKIDEAQEKARDKGEVRATFFSHDRVYMTLPDEVIAREKERIAKNPNLRINKATTEALFKKQKHLNNT